jgi:hypothetical protein
MTEIFDVMGTEVSAAALPRVNEMAIVMLRLLAAHAPALQSATNHRLIIALLMDAVTLLHLGAALARLLLFAVPLLLKSNQVADLAAAPVAVVTFWQLPNA